MFEYITTRILRMPLGKRVDGLLARTQALDSPPGQDGSSLRGSSSCNMLSEMATHSRRIQDRIALEAPRPRRTARDFRRGPPSVPTQEAIIYSLYASPDYSVITPYPPPPVYSETDPNASISVTLSEMGLCVRSGIAPQLPPPYSPRPGSPIAGDG